MDNLGRKPHFGNRRAPTLWTLTTAAGIAGILAMDGEGGQTSASEQGGFGSEECPTESSGFGTGQPA